MKKINQANKNNRYLKMGIIMAALLFLFHTLIFAILTPIYEACLSDIAIPDFLCNILRGVIDVFDTAVRTVGFTVLTVIFFMNYEKKMGYIGIYLGALAFRYIGAIVMSYIFNHSIMFDEIFMSVSSLILDAFFLAVAVLIIYLFARAHHRRSPIRQKSSKKADNSKKFYTLRTIFNKYKHLPLCMLAMGLFLTFIKLANRTVALFNQSFTEEFDYTGGTLSTVIGFVVDIHTFIISFAIACLLINSLYKRYERKKAVKELFKDTKKTEEKEEIEAE